MPGTVTVLKRRNRPGGDRDGLKIDFNHLEYLSAKRSAESSQARNCVDSQRQWRQSTAIIADIDVSEVGEEVAWQYWCQWWSAQLLRRLTRGQAIRPLQNARRRTAAAQRPGDSCVIRLGHIFTVCRLLWVRHLCDRRRRFRTASRSTLKLCNPTAKLNSLFCPFVGELQSSALGVLEAGDFGLQITLRCFCRHDTKPRIRQPLQVISAAASVSAISPGGQSSLPSRSESTSTESNSLSAFCGVSGNDRESERDGGIFRTGKALMPTKTRVFSPEHRAKLSAAKKGKVHSPETRAKIGAARKGRTHAPETRAKIGAASKGRTHTPEARAEIGAVHKGNTYRKGKKHSPETRAKMSAARKGKPKGPQSPEHRAKITAAANARAAINKARANPI